MLTFGFCATETHEPCQVRKEAAVSGPFRVPQRCLDRANCSGNACGAVIEERCTVFTIFFADANMMCAASFKNEMNEIMLHQSVFAWLNGAFFILLCYVANELSIPILKGIGQYENGRFVCSIICRNERQLPAARHESNWKNVIDHAIVFCLRSAHKVVTFTIVGDFFRRLSSPFRDEVVYFLALF